MGQAKHRGTYEERRQAAVAKKKATIETRPRDAHLSPSTRQLFAIAAGIAAISPPKGKY